MASKRLSNFELCRIVAILCVMLVHSTFASLGHNVSFWVMLLAGFSIIGVNVFVMLAGYFTATPKKTGLINLVFVCFFWMIVTIAVRYVFHADITYKHFFFVTRSNWFIPSYICLLFLAPVLNLFCNSVDKRTLWTLVFILLFLEIWFDWIPPQPSYTLGTNGGHSVLSFLILYLLARTIRLHGLPERFKRMSPFIYVGCSFLMAFLGIVLLRLGHENRVRWLFYDNNPIVIISSVAFLMSFERMKVDSSLVNHIAKSTLAVLLGHSAIFFLFTKQFDYLYNHFNGFKVVGYWTVAIFVVFTASVLIDQFRMFLWEPMDNWLKQHIKTDKIIQ